MTNPYQCGKLTEKLSCTRLKGIGLSMELIMYEDREVQSRQLEEAPKHHTVSWIGTSKKCPKWRIKTIKFSALKPIVSIGFLISLCKSRYDEICNVFCYLEWHWKIVAILVVLIQDKRPLIPSSSLRSYDVHPLQQLWMVQSSKRTWIEHFNLSSS